MTAAGITIEPDGSHDTGVCECCGQTSRRVWGYAYSGDRCIAAYFVHWTLGKVHDHGANYDLIIGDWGDDAAADRRDAVALAYRIIETGPAFMIIDAGTRDFSRNALVGHACRRDEVIGTARAQDAFDIVDAIVEQDSRIAELLVE